MRVLALILLLLLPRAALAADDGGYLTNWLESNLSGAGRTVKITGFEGALSSRATMKEMTIADAKGVWLTLKGVTLDWSRSALLGGRVQVDDLSADEIDLPRLPQAGSTKTAPPSAEAQGFSLPSLPVSVHIGKIAAKKVVLGAPVLGQAATLSVTGSLSLDGGAGSADLTLKRTDGKRGRIAVQASYGNTARKLALDLKVDEGPGGILSGLMNLPGAPSLSLSVAGTGPIDAYKADIRLATDGQPRLSGTVSLGRTQEQDGKSRSTFAADLGGDIAPLFAPDYAKFFGDDLALNLRGERLPSGQVLLDRLKLRARQLDLSGRMTLGADGLPRLIDISGKVASDDGQPVLLPLPGGATRIGHADLSVQFDASKGDTWTAGATLAGLERPGLTLADAKLTGHGTIRQANGTAAPARVEGTLRTALAGLAPKDAALAHALGRALTATTGFRWERGKPLHLTGLSLTGAGVSVTGDVALSGLGSALGVSGQATAKVADLSRFAALAGRPLQGSASARLSGSAQVLAGSFDATAAITGQGLRIGQPQVDGLLTGTSHITLSAKRDKTGTTIRDLTVKAASLNASAHGRLATGASDLSATLAFRDLGQLGKGYGGSLSATARLTQADGAGTIAVDATAQDLSLHQPQADRLLRGTTGLSLRATRKDGVIRIDKLSLKNPQISAQAGPGTGAGETALEARLSDLALLVPGFAGPVTAKGTVGTETKGYALKLGVTGPGGIDAQVAGSVAADAARADLTLRGTARADLANPVIAPRSITGPVRFDLRLDGPPRLSSLSGSVSLSGGRIAAPLLGLVADKADLRADLGQGRVAVNGHLSVGGGTIAMKGPISLLPPYASDLNVVLTRVGLKDPTLFSTTVSGAMAVKGPLAGGAAISGRLRLGDTELRVPSAGPDGAQAIPEGLIQQDANAAVRATLKRAGLGPKPPARGSKTPRRPFGLDLTISAPARVFVRGRGLDAELGGQFALTGTTADIVPIGSFDLRRGRLEILGKRFDLTKGSLSLQGRFIPYVHLEATTTNNGVTSTVTVDGDASDPQITFTSSPPLPQDEVIAQLLFGRSLSKLSPLQAAQLASAVATLAGKGGGGIVGKLRQSFGLDDLDVMTDPEGTTSVKAGKYLSKRLYTDVTVDDTGKTQVDLNLDVSKSITLRGKTGTSGDTGIGIFYDKDY